MKTKILSAFALTLALCCVSFAQSFDKAKLDKFFDALVANDKAMGSLAIAKDGKLLYSRAIGAGFIDGKNSIAANASTRYRIGSISKMFTAAMIFQLIDEGKLKLTDTLDKFYPTVPNAKTITVADLLKHRSGIHNFTDDADYATYEQKPFTQKEMIALIAKAKPDSAPNTDFAYSNPNFILLGYIVERLDKKPYADALKTRITSKVNLPDTYLGGKIAAQTNEAFSYNFSSGWQAATETDMSVPGGAGAVVSTPTDLTKFIEALFAGKIVSQTALNQMTNIAGGYGMGVFQYPVGGKKGFGHSGGIDGFNSMLIYVPEDKLSVAYISNGTSYPVNDIILAAFAAAYGKDYEVPSFAVVAVKAEDLDKLTGVYAGAAFPLKISITKKESTLYAQATGQSEFPLEATAPSRFKFDPAGIVLEFDAAKNQMTLKQAGRSFVLTKEK